MGHHCEGRMCLQNITTLAHADGLEDDSARQHNDPDASASEEQLMDVLAATHTSATGGAAKPKDY